MGNALKRLYLTEADYLVSEENAQSKHEFVAGEVYAMAGVGARRNRISINLTVKLDAATRNTSCEVFMADMKVRIDIQRAYYYPDVMLTCPDLREDDDHPLYRVAPCLLAEVLSPSTVNIDEREKWFHYRDIPVLRYYLLINAERCYVRLRNRDGTDWLEQTLGENDIVLLECGTAKISLGLDELYQRTGI
ncbi:conserved hypothetical protein [Gammaproteobacteria bacterium]